MKGLEEYIQKHGMHLTTKIVSDIVVNKWSPEEVYKSSQVRVYYNTTSSTLGDITYLVNTEWEEMRWSKTKCISFAISIISDYSLGKGFAFRHFLDILHSRKKEFDFTPYL